ncbi:hypothetical protein NM688_g1401 [Phlebia brevispora]|uniref:Uncharacterized protein n=1 Tax=Phlebia brevispora TaxID=194682 RepID=A0ACC1TBK6_9APHY|nr:hypothetical protein NM688_g1401 [Phlebia brevispora]
MTATLSDIAGQTFDYIIIGGGTAGLVLARRLSDNTDVSVLVLEAGEANLDDPTILMPWSRLKYIGNPKYDWSFETVKQVHSGDRSYVWPRGKGLGGSSAINFMLWNKPAREYIDAFEKLGNPGWNWEMFTKYSRRAETFTPSQRDTDVLTYDLNYRGESGPIKTIFPPLRSNLEEYMLEALSKHGIQKFPDTSSGTVRGASAIAYTADPVTRLRSYAANMYYQPVASRENLTVLVSAHVSKIETQSNNDGTVTATGVKFLHNGQEYEAYCQREVCLCAGAIMSPQILELSGIGDPAVLQKVGIKTKAALPGVGANVQEHLYTGLVYEAEKHSVSGREVQTIDPLLYPEEHAKHLELFPSGESIFNINTVTMAFVPLESVSANASQINEGIGTAILEGIEHDVYPDGLRKQYEVQLEFLRNQTPGLEVVLAPGPVARMKPDVNKKHITLCFALNSPFSRGTIHATSNDPLAPPEIDPRVFEVKYDLDTLVELVKFCRKLAKTEPLRSVLSEEEASPGPGIRTDDQIADWLKENISTTFRMRIMHGYLAHRTDISTDTIGSCSMLPLEDSGVVDPKLKVYIDRAST